MNTFRAIIKCIYLFIIEPYLYRVEDIISSQAFFHMCSLVDFFHIYSINQIKSNQIYLHNK